MDVFDISVFLVLYSICFADIRTLGHDNKSDLVEDLLTLMAREKHSPEVREADSQWGHDDNS